MGLGTYKFFISADPVHVLFFFEFSNLHALLHLLLPLLLFDFLILSDSLFLLLMVRLRLDFLLQALPLLQFFILHLFFQLHVFFLDFVFAILGDLLDDPQSILSLDDIAVSVLFRAQALVRCVPRVALIVGKVDRLILPSLVSHPALELLYLGLRKLELVNRALILRSLVVLDDPEDILFAQLDGLEHFRPHVLALLHFSLDSQLPQKLRSGAPGSSAHRNLLNRIIHIFLS